MDIDKLTPVIEQNGIKLYLNNYSLFLSAAPSISESETIVKVFQGLALLHPVPAILTNKTLCIVHHISLFNNKVDVIPLSSITSISIEGVFKDVIVREGFLCHKIEGLGSHADKLVALLNQQRQN